MFDTKLDTLLYLESMERQLALDIDALQNKVDNIKNDIEMLKADMVYDIKEYGLEYSNELFDVSIQKGRASVVIDDVDKIPANMITTRTYTEQKPSKNAIKYAIDAGHDIEGARIVTGGDKLNIKVK